MKKWLLPVLAVILVAAACAVAMYRAPVETRVSLGFPQRLPEVLSLPHRFPGEVSRQFNFSADRTTLLSAEIEFDDGGTGILLFRPDKTALEYTRFYARKADETGEPRIRNLVRFAADGRTYLEEIRKDLDGMLTLSGKRDEDGKYTEIKFHPGTTLAKQTRVYTKPVYWANYEGVMTTLLSDIRTWPNGQRQYAFFQKDINISETSAFDEIGHPVFHRSQRGVIESGFINWQETAVNKLVYEVKRGETVPNEASYWIVDTTNFNVDGSLNHHREFGHNYMQPTLTIPGFGTVTQRWLMKVSYLPPEKRLKQDNFFLGQITLPAYDGKVNVVYRFMLSGSYRLREQTYDEIRPGVGKVSVRRKIRENGRIEHVAVFLGEVPLESFSFEDDEKAPTVSVPEALTRAYAYETPFVPAPEPDWVHGGM